MSDAVWGPVHLHSCVDTFVMWTEYFQGALYSAIGSHSH